MGELHRALRATLEMRHEPRHGDHPADDATEYGRAHPSEIVFLLIASNQNISRADQRRGCAHLPTFAGEVSYLRWVNCRRCRFAARPTREEMATPVGLEPTT